MHPVNPLRRLKSCHWLVVLSPPLRQVVPRPSGMSTPTMRTQRTVNHEACVCLVLQAHTATENPCARQPGTAWDGFTQGH